MEDVAPLMLLNVELFVDDCHWMLPVYPLNVSVVLFVPEFTMPAPVIVPEADAALTVTSPDTLLVLVQPEEFVTMQ